MKTRTNPKILIGFLNKGNQGSIPTITKAFIDGLAEKYEMIPFYMERKYGNNSRAKFAFSNIFYFIIHYVKWIFCVLYYRPQIVHFPVTSFLNCEKSMIFLLTGKLMGVKIAVGHLHGGAFIEFWKGLPGLRKTYLTYLFSKLDSLIVLSSFWQKFFYEKIPQLKTYIVNNPIDVEFENLQKRERDYENTDLLFVGTIGRRKGVIDILEVAKLLKTDTTINLVGKEENKKEFGLVLQKINAYGLTKKIFLPGALYNEEKKICLATAEFLFFLLIMKIFLSL